MTDMRNAHPSAGRAPMLQCSYMLDVLSFEVNRVNAPFHFDDIKQMIQRALDTAGLNARSGPMKGVSQTIHRALSRAGLQIDPVGTAPDHAVVDGDARAARDGLAPPWPGAPHFGRRTRPLRRERPEHDAPPPGDFLSLAHSGRTGTRKFKLYVPARPAVQAMPLVVMLHGCKQSPDDFAAGTRMNHLAEAHGFLVAYPAQAANDNGSRCWNWYKAENQARDRGEPALIAGIIREIAEGYRVDHRRIYVAGLSAGAAMAVILAETYPELIAGIGAHSGLPFAAAHDVTTAFGAMRSGAGAPKAPPRPPEDPPGARPILVRPVPTIVFHGDRDRTVDASNGSEIASRAVARATARANGRPPRATVERGSAAGGRTFIRTVHSDGDDRPIVEEWVLHGAGHAWSGGSSGGSFTDANGPDASAEMVRFFLTHKNR